MSAFEPPFKPKTERLGELRQSLSETFGAAISDAENKLGSLRTQAAALDKILSETERLRIENDALRSENWKLENALSEARKDLLNKQTAESPLVNEAIVAALKGRGLGKDAVILIDGSGSMQPPLNKLAAIGAASVKKAQPGSKVFFFGSTQGAVEIPDEQALARATAKWLNSGTDLAPTLRSPGVASGKRFLIISDGDIFDAEASAEAVRDILKKDKNATFDFIIVGTSHEGMMMKFSLKVAREMENAGSRAQKPLFISRITEQAALQDALVRISDLRAPRKSRNKTPAPGKR